MLPFLRNYPLTGVMPLKVKSAESDGLGCDRSKRRCLEWNILNWPKCGAGGREGKTRWRKVVTSTAKALFYLTRSFHRWEH